jgi:glycosyltransferase involved in cell wall biosynthesis
MGLRDVGWNIIPLMERECTKNGIKDSYRRLLITHPNLNPSNAVSEEVLNTIYNTADVGLNTSLGEGWGLVSFEHSAAGVAQIVPDYSATKEIYQDKALLLPIRQYLTATTINTEGGLVHEDDVAEALETYYTNEELRLEHAAKMLEYIRRDEFKWSNVAKLWDTHIKEII